MNCLLESHWSSATLLFLLHLSWCGIWGGGRKWKSPVVGTKCWEQRCDFSPYRNSLVCLNPRSCLKVAPSPNLSFTSPSVIRLWLLLIGGGKLQGRWLAQLWSMAPSRQWMKIRAKSLCFPRYWFFVLLGFYSSIWEPYWEMREGVMMRRVLPAQKNTFSPLIWHAFNLAWEICDL